MNQESIKSLEESMQEKPIRRISWPAFVESDIVNFFNAHDLEKIAVEDGSGNKAKLSRQKDNGIKVEYSSTTIL
jgi:hypothetical protein